MQNRYRDASGRNTGNPISTDRMNRTGNGGSAGRDIFGPESACSADKKRNIGNDLFLRKKAESGKVSPNRRHEGVDGFMSIPSTNQ